MVAVDVVAAVAVVDVVVVVAAAVADPAVASAIPAAPEVGPVARRARSRGHRNVPHSSLPADRARDPLSGQAILLAGVQADRVANPEDPVAEDPASEGPELVIDPVAEDQAVPAVADPAVEDQAVPAVAGRASAGQAVEDQAVPAVAGQAVAAEAAPITTLTNTNTPGGETPAATGDIALSPTLPLLVLTSQPGRGIRRPSWSQEPPTTTPEASTTSSKAADMS